MIDAELSNWLGLITDGEIKPYVVDEAKLGLQDCFAYGWYRPDTAALFAHRVPEFTVQKPVVVLCNRAIQEDHGADAGHVRECIAIHELAHALETEWRPSPIPSTAAIAEALTEDVQAMAMLPDTIQDAQRRHGPRFIRTACHMAYRAERHGWQVMGGLLFAGRSWLRPYCGWRMLKAALVDELEAKPSFAELRVREVPGALSRLYGDQ